MLRISLSLDKNLLCVPLGTYAIHRVKCGCWSSKAYTLVADGDGGCDNAKSLTEKRGGHRR